MAGTSPRAPGTVQRCCGEGRPFVGQHSGVVWKWARPAKAWGSKQISLRLSPCWGLCPLTSDGDMGHQQRSRIRGGRASGPDKENQNGCRRQPPGRPTPHQTGLPSRGGSAHEMAGARAGAGGQVWELSTEKRSKQAEIRENREGRGEICQSQTLREQRQARPLWGRRRLCLQEAQAEWRGGEKPIEFGWRCGKWALCSSGAGRKKGLKIRAVGRGDSRYTRRQVGQRGCCDPHQPVSVRQ